MAPGGEAKGRGAAFFGGALHKFLAKLPRGSNGRRFGSLALVSLSLAVVALACAAWFGDRYFAYGVTVDWYTQHHGKRVRVARTIEHRTSFFNTYRPLSRYVQNWNFHRLGVPDHNPPIDAEIKARIAIPPGGPRWVDVQSSGQTSLRFDGAAPSGALRPGEHTIRVRWRQPVTNLLGATLVWAKEGSGDPGHAEVPRTALRPIEGNWPSSRKLFWLLFSLSSALLLALLLWTVTAKPGPRRRRFALLATIAVVSLGGAYRLYDYQVMPHHGENDDEFFAIFNGWSLINEGRARGWTPWPEAYPKLEYRRLPRFASRFAIVSPYFEHPPALHLLAGLATTLGGADHWLHAKLKYARLVPIGLSLVAIALLIAIGRRLFPASAAPWLGGLLYAVLPNIALQGRVVKEEALLAPLALGMVLLFLKWRDDGYRRRPLIAAAVLAGLCTLTKITGLAFVGALTVLVLTERRWREALLAFGVGLAVSLLLLIYAAALGWDVFWIATKIQSVQSERPVHWNIFLKYFDVAAVNHNLIGKGWALYLWLASLAAAYRISARTAGPIVVPLIAYLGAIGLGAGNWLFGWYPMPLYLFLCLLSGKFLADLWEQPDLLSGTLFVVLLVMYFLNFSADPNWYKQPANSPMLRRLVTLVLVVGIGPFVLAQIWRTNRAVLSLARSAFAVGMIVVVVGGGLFVARYEKLYQTHGDFDQDGYFHGEEPMNNKLRRCNAPPDPGDATDTVPLP